MTRRLAYTLFCMMTVIHLQAQVTGGQTIFTGLTLENSPRVMGLGGIVVANPSDDISFVVQNPALLDSSQHRYLSINLLDYYAQTTTYSAVYGHYLPQYKTTLATAITYNNYGNMQRTDNLGNELGTLSAVDWGWQLSASRHYMDKWRYGASFKLMGANYDGHSALGLLLDAGVYYTDTAQGITYGAVAKNIGWQVKKFNPNQSAESLPFDMQLGFSKKFKHIPFRFSATVHHLFEWNIRYDNPADISVSNSFGTSNDDDGKSYFVDKLFRHFIFSGELLLSDKFDLMVSYNHLRRSELSLPSARGLSGFAFGFNLHYRKWGLHYAKSVYNQTGGTNFIGIDLKLNQFF